MLKYLFVLLIISISLIACTAEASPEPAPAAAQAEPVAEGEATQPPVATATPLPVAPTATAGLDIDPNSRSPASTNPVTTDDALAMSDGEETAGEPSAAAQFETITCSPEMPGQLAVACGILSVPENRSKPNSPTIDLVVAILKAPGPKVRPDPIIYLAGGPGGSALSDLMSDPDTWPAYPFSQDRDLIFIDQRGTGYSIPSLNCPEVEFDEVFDGSAEQACHDRLVAAGIDLTAYNTTENAADIAALAQALNYDSWNILGVSYGTRLALAVMRDHPAGIRSVILDSPFPPNANSVEEETVIVWEAMEILFRDCQNDAECEANFPDLERVLLDTVDQLNNDPQAEISGDDLLATIQSALFAGEEAIYLLPWMIYEVSEGRYDLYDEVADIAGDGASRFQGGGSEGSEDEDRTDSEGMYTSVICRDEYAFSDYDHVESLAEAALPEEALDGLFSTTAQTFDDCAMWGAGAAASIENAAVISDIPTLILVGEYDPVTPPQWGRLTAETLSNGYYFELPGSGHSLLSANECAIQAADAFIRNPGVEPDRSCVNRMSAPLFELP
ncbi:MAG: alpha/beta fold hydrolase [Anaerolineales bacterium]|nr:alpha/beta fold hydrolase [Anaerolineales bacterium]